MAGDLYALRACEEEAGWTCGLEEGAKELAADIGLLGPDKSTGQDCAVLGGCLARVLVDTDSAFYAAHDNDPDEVDGTIEAIFAQVNERYAFFHIRHEISHIERRPDPLEDPYADPAIDTGSELLATVGEQWPVAPSGKDVDLVHLLYGGGAFAVPAGQSHVGKVCTFGGSGMYSFAQVLSNSCSSSGLVMHELGHSWGSIEACGVMAPTGGQCNSAWCGSTLTSIPAQRDFVDGICLDLIPSRDARIVSQSVPTLMTGGQQYPASITVENTGVTAWDTVGAQCDGFRLAQVGSTAWSPIRADLSTPVLPGRQATFSYTVTAPAVGGEHDFQVQMVEECTAFFGDESTNVVVSVTPAVKDAEFISQTVPSTMVAGQQYAISVTVKNSGNVDWDSVGALCEAYRLALVGSSGWTPIRADLSSQVPAVGQATLNFNVTAPSTPGPYTFRLRMVHECVEFFGDLGTAVQVTVT